MKQAGTCKSLPIILKTGEGFQKASSLTRVKVTSYAGLDRLESASAAQSKGTRQRRVAARRRVASR